MLVEIREQLNKIARRSSKYARLKKIASCSQKKRVETKSSSLVKIRECSKENRQIARRDTRTKRKSSTTRRNTRVKRKSPECEILLERDSESATMTVNCRFSCSSRPVDIQSIDDLHAFSSQSIHSSNDLYNTHLLEALRHRLFKKKIEVTHILNLTSNQQINTQNIKQKI